MSIEARKTSEIYARRFLNYGPDESIIFWAERMVLAGFKSDNLFILLGEIQPFNRFEIDSILDRIQAELRLPQIGSEVEAIEIIATAFLRRFIHGETGSTATMFRLSQLYLEEERPDNIYDFFLLHHAADTLATGEDQYYWPDAHHWNIEKVIYDRSVEWIEEHPFTEWQQFEWQAA